MDSWIFQGGYPAGARVAVRRRQPRRAAPAALPLRRRRRRAAEWAVPGPSCASAPATRRRAQAPARGRRDHRRRCWRPTRWWWSTPAPTASSACATTPPSWPGSPGPALAGLSAAERYSLVDDAWAAVVAGPPDGRGVRPLRGGLRRRARPRGVAGDRHRPALVPAAARRRRPTSRSRPASAALVGPVVERLAGSRATARVISSPSSAACSPGCSPCSATTPRPGALPGDPRRCAERSRAGLGGHQRRGRRRQRRGLRGLPRPLPLGVHAAGPVAQPLCPRRVPRGGADRAHPGAGVSGEVKSQDAPFLIGRCIANRNHGELAWRSSASGGPRPTPLSRYEHHPHARPDQDADEAGTERRHQGILFGAPRTTGGAHARSVARTSGDQRQAPRS